MILASFLLKKTLLILFFLALEETESFQGVFWHVCDVHLNKTYKTSKSAYFGEYKSNSPFTLIQSEFSTMKKIYLNPDFIMLNGDNVCRKTVNDSEFADSIMMVSEELQKNLPNSHVLPSLGNHDVNPANLYDVGSLWCQNISHKWEIDIKSDEKQTSNKSYYYSRRITSKETTVNVIILSTILWYSVDSHVKNTKVPVGQFHWLTNELQRSRNNKTKSSGDIKLISESETLNLSNNAQPGIATTKDLKIQPTEMKNENDKLKLNESPLRKVPLQDTVDKSTIPISANENKQNMMNMWLWGILFFVLIMILYFIFLW